MGDIRPLHVAAFIGNELILQTLISKLTPDELESADKEGDRAIHYAALSDAYKSLHILLDHGAEINSRNNAGKTALHLAVKKENVDSCRKLLEAGAANSLRDSDGDRKCFKCITSCDSHAVKNSVVCVYNNTNYKMCPKPKLLRKPPYRLFYRDNMNKTKHHPRLSFLRVPL